MHGLLVLSITDLVSLNLKPSKFLFGLLNVAISCSLSVIELCSIVLKFFTIIAVTAVPTTAAPTITTPIEVSPRKTLNCERVYQVGKEMSCFLEANQDGVADFLVVIFGS
ncbi:uncharacterized protein LOC131322504 [Rhododendron vialii]|uniref:uncharacterized protein LOC131322504 n=1 Tax=Rhododendron vialii TaxID=182163 RepID=UPI00265D674E|nr:uncharacterized protein LOC131322504 [Rhododendron vialii]